MGFRPLLITFCLLAWVQMTASSIRAADLAGDTKDLVKATLISSVPSVIPGETIHLGIHLKMKPHWHTYWINPGESGEATKVKLSGPAGFEFGEIQWPLPRAIESFGAITYGYEDEVLLTVPVKVGKDVKTGGKAEFSAHVSWLACQETCIEGEARLVIALPVVKADQVQVASQAHGHHHPDKDTGDATFAKWKARLPVSGHQAVASIKQVEGDAGRPQARILVNWSQEVTKVEWFPVATDAVAIEQIKVLSEGKTSTITYKPVVYKPAKVPGGKVSGIVVFEDGKGRRHGVTMSFLVPIED